MLQLTKRFATHLQTSHTFPHGKYDFDAWGYNIDWPQTSGALPLMGRCSVAVEDVKFAFNAWMLLRLCMFYGLPHPTVLSRLRHTTPTMDIADRGNRLFYMHSHVGVPLASITSKSKVALTPSHPTAVAIDRFDFKGVAAQHPDGIELVLGMENGMSEAVVAGCDHHVFIPQYGSIGSLSMLSALSIAVHHAHAHLHPMSAGVATTGGVVHHDLAHGLGDQPTSGTYAPPRTCRPHDPRYSNMANDAVKSALAQRRDRFPMQLSVLMRNEIADRNIGATVRNANVFNCDSVLLFNRKKFSMRGTVGTHHYTPIRFFETRADLEASGALHNMEVWLLHSYYPYLQNFYHTTPASEQTWIDGKKGRRAAFSTFLRPDNASLRQWVSHQDVLVPSHPMWSAMVRVTDEAAVRRRGDDAAVYLDDDASIVRALQCAAANGVRGVVLACPEEGTTPHPELAGLADRIVYTVHPKRLAATSQRGLSPALATASALEKLRAAMTTLFVTAPEGGHHIIT